MKNLTAALALMLALALPAFAQTKEEQRLDNSAKVFQDILSNNGLPKSVLDKAECALIFPSVKKVAVGIGSSYGRGALICRKGATMNGSWALRPCTNSIREALDSSSAPRLRILCFW